MLIGGKGCSEPRLLPDGWVLEKAQLKDLDTIISFNRSMAKETEGKDLDLQTATSGVKAVLSDPNRGFYLIVRDELDNLVGQLMVTFEWSDWRSGWFWWIQSVYVRLDSRNRGVYAALHCKVLEMAKEQKDVVGLRLYVDSDNHVAQAAYQALEMEQTRYLLFEYAIHIK
ncbi:MAG TPA: GNAT family N-acetyltransferase [Myxococcota bacterium]|nr:GNAT family N-acetyltransferase [Myxococcota bacterium]